MKLQPGLDMRGFLIVAGVAIALCLLATQFLTLFVVPPIGAVPQGATVLMWRRGQMQFVDSADALCDRVMGGVSLLCRGMAMGAVAKDNTVLLRLPYSDWLYARSTGGKRWDR